MAFNPLVSIVIPLYNGANYIEEALTCAINQTYKNIEIIVVNDGSKDDGAGRDICQKYLDKIIYVEKENGGCASALNYGIKLAKGEYISWLSHDDLYDLTKIERQVLQYEKNGLDKENTAISNPARQINADGKILFHPQTRFKGYLSAKEAYCYLLYKKCFNGCGLLLPKNIFEKAGYFNESMRFVLDWNLWLKFAVAGLNFYLDDEVLVSNRCHSAQITANQKQLHVSESKQTVEELFELLKENEEIFFMKELYYLCYATKKTIWKEIRNYCKGKTSLSTLKAWKLRIKITLKRFAKKIYHLLRK
ncbi:MAG: glycosyltransferase [Clostridia bacterium]|nr:glycosyltransferase [Clostridia bacterium]